ncbi:GMC family oxidoreductase [Saccharospirillum mangrovi]|uniref:GMC family oxidoreductase n=1 Tax=Saccharospirillum mangrovi TaxID=2161747 RepID=UPI000D3C1286|nr:GMC family oxidoreductase N-terminal domain-containing protein [Saccharospirillum mangrovi]
MKARYDTIIVGGGSAGCVLAARLSEDPHHRVLLIEAGGSGRSPLISIPLGIAATIPGYAHNWAFESTPQSGLDQRRAFQPRGKGLGGSSAINAMIYTRGHPNDYNDWADMGLTDFAWNEVLPWFRRSENNSRGSSSFHGQDGPLSVSDLRSDNPATDAFLVAAQAAGFSTNDDFNGAQQDGFGRYQVTQKNGRRHSVAAAFLHPIQQRPNLHILTRHQVTALLFEGDRVVGVRARKGRSGDTEWRCSGDVILSAGAFQSPQLLMLSGIGPADELRRHNIDVRLDRPAVGANLQDHLDYTSAWFSPSSQVLGYGPKAMARLAAELPSFLSRGRGLWTSNVGEGGGYVRSRPDLDRPDFQIHFLIGVVDDHNRRLHLPNGFCVHACQLRPRSRGALRLTSADPLAPPSIDPGYFSDERDLDDMLLGSRISRDIVQQSPLDAFRGKPLFISDQASDEELRASIRQRADTAYHPIGTCRMGIDADAVVDTRFRVKGIDGLRVVDASVMPTLIGGNTNAPTIMLAERAADWIRQG